jgi:hypothetical protein
VDAHRDVIVETTAFLRQFVEPSGSRVDLRMFTKAMNGCHLAVEQPIEAVTVGVPWGIGYLATWGVVDAVRAAFESCAETIASRSRSLSGLRSNNGKTAALKETSWASENLLPDTRIPDVELTEAGAFRIAYTVPASVREAFAAGSHALERLLGLLKQELEKFGGSVARHVITDTLDQTETLRIKFPLVSEARQPDVLADPGGTGKAPSVARVTPPRNCRDGAAI